MTNKSLPIRSILLAFALFASVGTAFAQNDSTIQNTVVSDTAKSSLSKQKHPLSIALVYEFSDLSSRNLETNMSRNGQRYNVDMEVSHMFGVNGQYSYNDWISFFGLLGYRQASIDYTPRNRAEKEETMTSHNIFLQLGAEIGFRILTAKNYQFRALGFAGLVGGLNLIDDYYMSSPLFGYVRGIGVQLNIRHIFILGGFRSTHVYWHTYHSDHWGEDDYEFMADFDLMSSPFVSIGIGF